MSTEEKKPASAPAAKPGSGPQGLLTIGVVVTLIALAGIVFLIVTGRGAAPAAGANNLTTVAAELDAATPAPAPARPGAPMPNRGTLLPSGLRVETVREGTGPLVRPTDTVLVRYELRLPGGPVIESNMTAPRAAEMTPATVIPGFAEGMTRMRAGGEARLWVPPQLGYGAAVPPGAPFGPNDTLEFLIKIERILPAGTADTGRPAAGNSSNTTQGATETPTGR